MRSPGRAQRVLPANTAPVWRAGFARAVSILKTLQFEALGCLRGKVGLSGIEHSGTRLAIGAGGGQDEDCACLEADFGLVMTFLLIITKGAAAPQKHNIVGTTCRTRLVISKQLYYKTMK